MINIETGFFRRYAIFIPAYLLQKLPGNERFRKPLKKIFIAEHRLCLDKKTRKDIMFSRVLKSANPFFKLQVNPVP